MMMMVMMMMMGLGTAWRGSVGEGKERMLKMEVCCIHTYEDSIIKPNQPFEKGAKWEKENGSKIKKVKLFKVHCMHV
jgi:hypothetical protein